MTAAERLAHAWVEHLRAGGTTPWASWSADPGNVADAGFSKARGRPLPGAAQLEVVRRLALCRSDQDGVDFPRLAEVVLSSSGPGRGLGDLPLAGPAGPAAPAGIVDGFGPRAVNPEDVPEEELIRVGVGALVELLGEVDEAQAPPLRARRRRPWRRAFRLVGAPVDVAALRSSLAARGLVEGGRRPRLLVVGTDLDAMMRQTWTARVQAGGDTRWPRMWSRAVGRDEVPVRIDLPRVAGHWADRVGSERVHLVVAGDLAGLHRAAADALGLSDLAVDTGRAAVPPYSPAAVDVLRRLNAVLSIRVDASRAQLLRDRVLPRLLHGPAGGGLQAPERYRDWSKQRAVGIQNRLAAEGYAVHGNLDDLVTGHDDVTPGNPVRSDVLDTALRACLRAAEA